MVYLMCSRQGVNVEKGNVNKSLAIFYGKGGKVPVDDFHASASSSKVGRWLCSTI